MKENSHWVDFRLFHLGIERDHFNNHANHLDVCLSNSWSGHPTKKYIQRMDHWFDAGNYSFHMLFHNFSHSNAACRALIPRQRNAWNMSEPPGARTRQSAESSKGIVRGPLGYISGPCFE